MSVAELVITDTLIGEGLEPSKGALVFAHYEGFLEDGTKFDSSHEKGKPFQFVFGVGRVIKGWDQGLRHEGWRKAHTACAGPFSIRRKTDWSFY